MTTNYIERLDDVLIQPGRVDRKIEFRLADREIVGQLFSIVFKGSDDNDDEDVERLTHEFTDRVPRSEFSPAENRQSHESAVANVEPWMARVRGGKTE